MAMSESFFSRRVPFELLVFGDDLCFVPTVIVVGELEEDQAEHRRGVFAGLEIGVGAQVVGGTPEVLLELFELFFRHSVSRPITPSLKATHSTRFVERARRAACLLA